MLSQEKISLSEFFQIMSDIRRCHC